MLPPGGARWLIVPSLPATPGPVSTIVAFGRRTEGEGQNRAEDLRTVIATVSTRDHGSRTFNRPEDFLRFQESESVAAIGKLVSPRHRMLSASTVLDPSRGPMCVRYEYAVEDTGVAGFDGVPFAFELHGWRCLHPEWPRSEVDVGYSQRYRSGQPAAKVEAEVAPFLDGLVFTHDRPVFVATIPIGRGPQALAFADGSVWVAYGDHEVARIDPRTNQVVATVQVGRDPVGLAAGNEGLWVVNREDGTAGRIDPRTNRASGVVEVGGKPLTVAVGFGSVWVTEPVSGDLVRIDPATARVAARIAVGKEPSGVAVGVGAVWVTDYRLNKLLRVDPGTNRIALALDAGRARSPWTKHRCGSETSGTSRSCGSTPPRASCLPWSRCARARADSRSAGARSG